MEISAAPSDWTQVDEQRWAEFLATDTGRRLIPKLAEETPPLLALGDSVAVFVRSGEVRGVQLAIRVLLELAHPSKLPDSSSETSYPPLERDDAWQDGQKLEQLKQQT